MHSDDNDNPPPATFGQRHAITIMSAVLAILFAITIIVQVGC